MQYHRILAMVSAMALGSAVSSTARAWGPEGHAIVADIAEAHLTLAAAAQVTKLLALEKHHHLDEVSSWADDVRPQRPQTAPWHFVDIPLSAAAYDATRDCSGGNCVVGKIVDFTGVLSDTTAQPKDRLEALKWVVHFVGDVHQPLHAEDKNGDKGGNTVRLTYFHKSTDLHAIWDGAIIEQATGLKLGPHFTFDHQAVASVSRNLDSTVTTARRQEWAPSGLLDNLQPSVVAWAGESHGLAQTVAYPDLPQKRAGNWAVAYQAQAWPVVSLQLQKAGVRLAETLNESLK